MLKMPEFIMRFDYLNSIFLMFCILFLDDSLLDKRYSINQFVYLDIQDTDLSKLVVELEYFV